MKDTPFLDDWTPEDYETLARCLKNTCGAGGFVCAAFCEGALKGFASVEAGLFGAHMQISMMGNGPVTIPLDTRDWLRTAP